MHDIVIIGAGVIGGSIAHALSKYNLDVVVLEKENDISDETSKANSGIVHAGYDPEPDTLMAKLNVKGSQMMEELCTQLSVQYKKCGSLVLAFDDGEVKTVEELYHRGITNGVKELSLLNNEQVLAIEPNINPLIKSALHAKTGAVVSPWELTIALFETAVRNGVKVQLNQKVIGIKNQDDNFIVTTEDKEYHTKYVINCAGVHSDEIANLVGECAFKIKPDKGEYFLLDKSMGKLVNSVVFQAPTEVGKGVLVSPTAHGNLIVGPTNEFVQDKEDVSTTREKLEFIKKLSQKSVPSISFRDNIRNFAGVRANSDHKDFYIKESKNIKGFINVSCIKSPGLSAAPAIGEYVCDMIVNTLKVTKKQEYVKDRHRIIFKHLSSQEKNELIKKDSTYGQVICRCETITKGEILQALNSPIPPRTVEGVKRRCDAGMGRCQGGFCSPRIVEIIAQHYGIDKSQVLLDKEGSHILVGKTKSGGGEDER